MICSTCGGEIHSSGEAEFFGTHTAHRWTSSCAYVFRSHVLAERKRADLAKAMLFSLQTRRIPTCGVYGEGL